MKYLVSLFITGSGLLPVSGLAAPPAGTGALAVPLSNAEAWKRLPGARRGSRPAATRPGPG